MINTTPASRESVKGAMNLCTVAPSGGTRPTRASSSAASATWVRVRVGVAKG